MTLARFEPRLVRNPPWWHRINQNGSSIRLVLGFSHPFYCPRFPPPFPPITKYPTGELSKLPPNLRNPTQTPLLKHSHNTALSALRAHRPSSLTPIPQTHPFKSCHNSSNMSNTPVPPAFRITTCGLGYKKWRLGLYRKGQTILDSWPPLAGTLSPTSFRRLF